MPHVPPQKWRPQLPSPISWQAGSVNLHGMVTMVRGVRPSAQHKALTHLLGFLPETQPNDCSKSCSQSIVRIGPNITVLRVACLSELATPKSPQLLVLRTRLLILLEDASYLVGKSQRTQRCFTVAPMRSRKGFSILVELVGSPGSASKKPQCDVSILPIFGLDGRGRSTVASSSRRSSILSN